MVIIYGEPTPVFLPRESQGRGSLVGCRPWDSPGKNTGAGCHFLLQCMKVKSESEVAQSCPTLSDPMDCSLPDSSFHGIFQARVLEWGAIAFSGHLHLGRGIFIQPVESGFFSKQTLISYRLLATSN